MKNLISCLYWLGVTVFAYRMYFTLVLMGVALVVFFPLFHQAGFHGLTHVQALLQEHDPWD